MRQRVGESSAGRPVHDSGACSGTRESARGPRGSTGLAGPRQSHRDWRGSATWHLLIGRLNLEDPARRRARGPRGTRGALPLKGVSRCACTGRPEHGRRDTWCDLIDSGAWREPPDERHVSGHLAGQIRGLSGSDPGTRK